MGFPYLLSAGVKVCHRSLAPVSRLAAMGGTRRAWNERDSTEYLVRYHGTKHLESHGGISCGQLERMQTTQRHHYLSNCGTPWSLANTFRARFIHTSGVVAQQQANENQPSHTLRISEDKKTLAITDSEGEEDRFNASWLRENCRCVECVEPRSGQRSRYAADAAESYNLKDVSNHDGVLHIRWHEEDHEGVVPLAYLHKHSYSAAARQRRMEDSRHLPCPTSLRTFTYESITGSENEKYEWLRCLNEDQICLVDGVPEDVTIVEVAEKVSYIQRTLYGRTYLVESKPDPVNIAYSPRRLGFHNDLPYYESSPGYLFLLCKSFDTCIEGGGSSVVDGLHEAERLRQLYPDYFETLSRVPATFFGITDEREERATHLEYRRPHFTVDNYSGQITGIHWSPFSEGALFVAEEDVEPYYEAYYQFAKMLEESETKRTFKFKPGLMLVINNRRHMHKRDEYKLNGGYRALAGCYVLADEMQGQARIYSKKFNNGKYVVRHVMNQAHF